MTTSILHVSDTHIGRWQYNSDERKQDYIDAFEQVISTAIELNVDAVIHTGDLFDDPTPHSTDIKNCIDVLELLDENDIPFYAIVGNHERKRGTQWIEIIQKLSNAHRLTSNPVVINEEVALYGVDSIRGNNISEDSLELQPTDDDLYKIVCMHELVSPPIPEYVHKDLPESYSAKQILDALTVKPDAIALGDYHERVSDVYDDVEMFYPGSTEKTSFNESDEKSVSVLQIEDNSLKRVRHTIDTRPFKLINVPVTKNGGIVDVERRLEEVDIRNAVVKIQLTGEDEHVDPGDIRRITNREGAIVTLIDDDRDDTLEDIDEQLSNYNADDIETVLNTKINDLNLSEPASEIEELVRQTDEVDTKTGVREQAEKIVKKHNPTMED